MVQLPSIYVNNVPDYLQQWQPGVTPLSTDLSVALASVAYLAIIFGGQELMKERKPIQLKTLFLIHNAFLSAGSAIVLFYLAREIFPIVYNHGFFYSICAFEAFTPVARSLYIVNYYFKYWEFVDTFFLVLKKKPLQFLHVFHHTATAILCYTQLNGETSVQWTVIGLNLLVHVLMYYYYFAATAFPGKKIWWKKYLTTLQITQFVVDLNVTYFATYSYFVYNYFRDILPTMGNCAGTEGAAVFGCALLTSYLFLFIAFYKKTYGGKKPSSKKDAKKTQ